MSKENVIVLSHKELAELYFKGSVEIYDGTIIKGQSNSPIIGLSNGILKIIDQLTEHRKYMADYYNYTIKNIN